MKLDALQHALERAALPRQEVAEFAAALARRPPRAVRVRPGLARATLPFASRPVPWHDRAVLVSPDVRPGGFAQFAAGDYYVQDAGGALATRLVDASPGEVICDLCAAPGGKSTALLESLGATGWLLANESISTRLPPLQFNLARHGAIRYVLSHVDPEPLAAALGPIFDAVLVDAPCSGQSLVGRGKQTDAAFQPRAIQHCAARQTRILAAAARLVRPAGRLVYSTCTFSYAENEGMLEQFLQEHPAWRLEPHTDLAPYQSAALPGSYRLWPHRHPTAGGFAARLRNTASVSPATDGLRNTRSQRARMMNAIHESQVPAEFNAWGTLADGSVWTLGQRVIGWPDVPPAALLRVVSGGPELAVRPHRNWRPAYGLARRGDAQWTPRETLQLNDSAACDFLHGAPLRSPQRGWLVATWNKKPLGWLKGDGTWAKNHLPKTARLTGTLSTGPE